VSEHRAAGTLTFADLGKHVTIDPDPDAKWQIQPGYLVQIGHGTGTGQTFVGLARTARGRQTWGIHTSPDRTLTLEIL
jgi:hypothetical protein